MNRLNRFSFWVVITSASLPVMAGSIIAPILNMMREGLNADPASVGYIITTHGLFIALFSPLFGIIIDKSGTKRPFVFGLILYGLAGASGIFITSYWVMIISRALLGVAAAAILISITLMILNLYTDTERNKVMGWRQSSNSFSGVLGPLIGGLLGRISWHIPFAAYLIAIPLGICALFVVPDVRGGKVQVDGDVNKEDSVFKIFKSTPVLFAILGLMFTSSVLLFNIVVFIPQLLEKKGISNPFYIGLFLSIIGIAAALTALNYARIKARLSNKKITVIALVLWTVGFIIISQVSSNWIIALSIALFGIGFGAILPMAMVWVGENVPISFRGRVSSFLPTCGFIGQFLSPIIFGPIALSLGLNNVFLVTGGISAILLLLFLFGIRKW